MGLLLFFSFSTSIGQVAGYQPPELQKIDVVEKTGQTIPLDLVFTNDSGKQVTLSDYFNQGKPVVLVLAYYNCPMLCSLILNGLTEAAKQVSLEPGKDYTILTISIDPTETYDLAAAKKKNYMAQLSILDRPEGWTFFVGEKSQSKALADSLGFLYYYDEKKQEYAHPAVLHVLTGEGQISRYLYGIEFKPNDLKISLLEAAKGKIGNSFDKILLYCFHYDPDSKGYVVFAGNVMKLGGLLTIVILGLFLGLLWSKETLFKKR